MDEWGNGRLLQGDKRRSLINDASRMLVRTRIIPGAQVGREHEDINVGVSKKVVLLHNNTLLCVTT